MEEQRNLIKPEKMGLKKKCRVGWKPRPRINLRDKRAMRDEIKVGVGQDQPKYRDTGHRVQTRRIICKK